MRRKVKHNPPPKRGKHNPPLKRGRGRPLGSTNKSGKSALVVQRMMQPEGATRDELIRITGWSFGPTYLYRLAMSRNATAKQDAEGRWRLIPNESA